MGIELTPPQPPQPQPTVDTENNLGQDFKVAEVAQKALA